MTLTPFLNITSGTVLDERFEVIEILGTGGFATVYKARQLNIDRTVAVKVLGINPNKMPEEMERFFKRFYLEAKQAASINHPDIVTIFDFGVTDGLPYIVMEHLQGRTLDDEVEQNGPMAPERALPLFVRCLDALDAAHKRRIVHKDLKPSNLFLTNPNSMVETLRILDFGIAAMADSEDAERLTHTDQYVGTAMYCAPEYYDNKLVTPALDVYQMGLVLVEALQGRPVVQAGNPMRAIMRHCSGDLTLPADLLAGPLGPILRKALAMEHTDRYLDAGQFRDALAWIDPADIEPLSFDDVAHQQAINAPSGELFERNSDEFFFDEDGNASSERTKRSGMIRRARPTPNPEVTGETPPPSDAPQSSSSTGSTDTGVSSPPPQSASKPPYGLYAGGILALVAVIAVAVAMSSSGTPNAKGNQDKGGTPSPSEVASAQADAQIQAAEQQDAAAKPKTVDKPPKDTPDAAVAQQDRADTGTAAQATPAPPSPVTLRFEFTPRRARLESTRENGRDERITNGRTEWTFDPATTPPPWELFVSSPRHKDLYLRITPNADAKDPTLEVSKGHNDGRRIIWDPPTKQAAAKDGAFALKVRLDKAPNSVRRTPGNQLID